VPSFQKTLAFAAALFLFGSTSAASVPFRSIFAISYFGLQPVELSAILALSAVTGVLASLTLGHWSDLVKDRRSVIMLASLTCLLGNAVVSYFQSPLSFAIATAFILPIGDTVLAQMFAYTRHHTTAGESKARSTQFSILRISISLAWVGIPPLSGALASNFGLMWTWYLSLSLSVLATAYAGCLLLRAGAGPRPSPQSSKAGGQSFGWSSSCVVAGIWMSSLAMQVHGIAVPLVITGQLGGTVGDVGLMGGVLAAAEIPSMAAAGLLMLRVDHRLVGTAGSAMYLLYLWLAISASAPADIVILQLINGPASAAMIIFSISFLQELFSGRHGLSAAFIPVVTITSSVGAAALFWVVDAYVGVIQYNLVFAAIGAGSGSVLIGMSAAFLRKRVGPEGAAF
jgi:SET family sugar efflux transporter-like MFS transporter